ncbi:phosphodiester glycosidase family protein [Amycolatopsis taiwanensis]|uniref:phosphodiester glycosidase family protein n=1 Tax=Amycolatopsis taiwanensis TaxID=342230 RepID=UPI000487CE44|nr:phosphodiester glycosidase family protein [Amycolatopsis taiwanensis]
MNRHVCRRTVSAVCAALAVTLAPVLASSPASAAEAVAPGVTYESFTVTSAHGPVVGYLVRADLRNPQVSLDLLHPASVGARETVSGMATAQHAVAGVNGDFFNISETHEGVPATGSSVGPEIAEGRDLKFAVPDGQRFGPAMAPGDSTRDVFGMGVDHRARLATLELAGTAHTSRGTFAVDGLNQYALPVDGIGLYTHDWGTVSRARAACGTDTDRSAPCSANTAEVVVRQGHVVSQSDTPGAGDIPADTEVLLGRDGGADTLRALQPGDHVQIGTRMSARALPSFEFAVGGFRILSGGQPLPKLDAATLAPRTGAGVSADGRTVYLLTIDGRTAGSTGASVAELADMLRSFGAVDAMNLDGGGSSTVAVAEGSQVAVKNAPSDGAERPVANGIGVFTRR